LKYIHFPVISPVFVGIARFNDHRCRGKLIPGMNKVRSRGYHGQSVSGQSGLCQSRNDNDDLCLGRAGEVSIEDMEMAFHLQCAWSNVLGAMSEK
jgi:hypothetical protein